MSEAATADGAASRLAAARYLRLRGLDGLPVRRALTLEAIVILRLGPLAPAGIRVFLALHRQITGV